MESAQPIVDVSASNHRLASLAGFEALVFDLDGTLIDSAPGISASLKAAFRFAGRNMPRAEVRSVIGPPIGVIARRIEPTLTDAEVKLIEQEYRSSYDSEGWRETVAFEGVVEALPRLHAAGWRLFVVTNKPRVPTQKILALLKIESALEAVLSRDSRTPRYASKAEMLADLMAIHKLEPSSTVMVGDTQEDGEAALANHLQFVHVSYGYGAVSDASMTASRFQDIEDMCRRED